MDPRTACSSDHLIPVMVQDLARSQASNFSSVLDRSVVACLRLHLYSHRVSKENQVVVYGDVIENLEMDFLWESYLDTVRCGGLLSQTPVYFFTKWQRKYCFAILYSLYAFRSLFQNDFIMTHNL